MTKEQKQLNGEGIVFSINGAGIIEYPLAKRKKQEPWPKPHTLCKIMLKTKFELKCKTIKLKTIKL